MLCTRDCERVVFYYSNHCTWQQITEQRRKQRQWGLVVLRKEATAILTGAKEKFWLLNSWLTTSHTRILFCPGKLAKGLPYIFFFPIIIIITIIIVIVIITIIIHPAISTNIHQTGCQEGTGTKQMKALYFDKFETMGKALSNSNDWFFNSMVIKLIIPLRKNKVYLIVTISK